MTPAEAVSSILIPIPFILSAFVLTSPSVLPENEATIAKLMGGQRPYLSILGVCSLTAATLVVAGSVGEFTSGKERTGGKSLGSPKPHRAYRGPFFSIANANHVMGRILSVGLPFFAASKLGGARVAIVMASALAAELTPLGTSPNSRKSGDLLQLALSRRWTLGILLLQILTDVSRMSGIYLPLQAISGYLSLAVSILVLPPPYPTSVTGSGSVASGGRGNGGLGETFAMLRGQGPKSPLVSTPNEIDLTVAAGVISTIISFLVFVSSARETQVLTLPLLMGGSVVAIVFATSLLFTDSKKLKSPYNAGLGLGLTLCLIVQELIDPLPISLAVSQVALACLSWCATYLDTPSARAHVHHTHDHHDHDHDHDHDHTTHSHGNHSKLTGVLISASEGFPLLHSILIEKDSRRILYFMCLNFGFMLIQTFYAVLTGSLGLLSDSIHMLFDCLALVVGLCAAVMSKWPPSLQFPYGFGKVDTLAGFANGVFLMLISVEIIYEAVERFLEGSQMQRIGELLIVSFLGLVVNLVGMAAFGHAHVHAGHDHSHGGHSHAGDHSHSDCNSHGHDHGHHHETKTPLPFSVPLTPSKLSHELTFPDHDHDHAHDHAHDYSHSHVSPPTHSPPSSHSHGHGHGHHHDHGNENMHGIFLHVLADTMGSVSVVLSTILIHYTGWSGWDALASILIALLIFAAAVPLVRGAAQRLLLSVPERAEFDLREALADVGGLRGVAAVTAPRFWVRGKEGDGVQGVMHVVAGRQADLDDVMERARETLRGRGLEVLVQVEREGEARCWCGGGTRTL